MKQNLRIMASLRSLIITLNADETVTVQAIDLSTPEEIVKFETTIINLKSEFISMFNLFVNGELTEAERATLNDIMTRAIMMI